MMEKHSHVGSVKLVTLQHKASDLCRPLLKDFSPLESAENLLKQLPLLNHLSQPDLRAVSTILLRPFPMPMRDLFAP